MAGKFTNTRVTNTTNSLIEGAKKRLENNMYRWNNTTVTPVTYLNVDKDKLTFDEGSGLTYSGYDGSFKFNQINNFPLSGLEKVLSNYDYTDEGLAGYEVTGDALVLPNSGIIPYPGDHFSIDYIVEAKQLLFRVTEVQDDTLENGSNMYKITYKLITTNPDIVKQYQDNIVRTYEFIEQNLSSKDSTPVVLTKDYNRIREMDLVSSALRKYYEEVYYSPYVQTFVFTRNNLLFYDPYMIEFLMSTKIMTTYNKYLYVNHQTNVPSTFHLKYRRSFLSMVENKDKARLSKIDDMCYGSVIDSKLNVFSTRYEEYYELEYFKAEPCQEYNNFIAFKPIEDDAIKAIINNELTKTIEPPIGRSVEEDLNGAEHVEDDIQLPPEEEFDDNGASDVEDDIQIPAHEENFPKEDIMLNIIIKYFNGADLADEDIEKLKDVDIELGGMKYFYYVPIVIYILEFYIKNMMKK